MYDNGFLQTDVSPTNLSTSDVPMTFADLTKDKRVFRLSKKGRRGDPIGMLNAVLTADVPTNTGHGVYAFLLDAKARVQTDVTVLRDGEDLLIVTEKSGSEAAKNILGRYAPFSRVELVEMEAPVFGIYGEDAAGILGISPSEYESVAVDVAGVATIATGVSLPLKGLLLVCESSGSSGIPVALGDLGLREMPADELESRRIAGASPVFGKDITPDNFPAETNIQGMAVSFTKGCYPGQETVARTHYRGQPNKRLHRFVVEGDTEPGTAIFQNGKDVGYITSVAPLRVDGNVYALGYLKRKADTNSELLAGEAKLVVSDVDGT